MSKKFITVKDGRVFDIITGAKPVGEGPFIEVPADCHCSHGDKYPDFFDESMKRIPDMELVKRGTRKDNRGVVYNTNDKNSRIIYDLDEELQADETKIAPQNERFETFDKKENKWIIDKEAKKLAEEEAAVWRIQAEIAETEKEMLPLIIAQNRGRATSADLEKIDQLDALIEAQLKPELNRKKVSLDTLKAKKSA